MKTFTKNDSGFVCQNCGKSVQPLLVSSRNHCPFCLHSIHIDINPGDRNNDCKGLMMPIAVEINSNKGKVLVFKCLKCGEIKKNKVAQDDSEKVILEIFKKG